MHNLARYSYCFKFFEAGSPFKVIPYSVALVPIDGRGAEFHALILEGLEMAVANPEFFPKEFVEKLLTSGIQVRDRKSISNALLKFIPAAEEVQLWSLHDTHCRHFMAELYGGMDQNNSFQQFMDKGIVKVLPRDMNHIYYGLGKPALPPKPYGHEMDALKIAKWQVRAFDTLRAYSANQHVHVIPTNATPPGHQRIFHDWEYYRESPFVLWPLSLGATTQDRSRSLHVVIDEGIRAFEQSRNRGAHWEWLRMHVIPKLDGVERVTAEEATRRLLAMVDPGYTLEIWSDDDNHDRHLTGSLGIGPKSFYKLAREDRGAEHILFRDTRHLRLFLGNPKPIQRDPRHNHNALADAQNLLLNFEDMNAYAMEQGIVRPETILPVDFDSNAPSHSHDHELSQLHHGL